MFCIVVLVSIYFKLDLIEQGDFLLMKFSC